MEDHLSNSDKLAMRKPYQLFSHFRRSFLLHFVTNHKHLVEELVRQKDRLQDVFLYNVVIGSPCIYADPTCHSHFKIRTFLGSSHFKSALFKSMHVTICLLIFQKFHHWINQEKIDVALIQVSPPNDEGYCNLGLSVDVVQTLIKNAKVVIAQVNNELP